MDGEINLEFTFATLKTSESVRARDSWIVFQDRGRPEACLLAWAAAAACAQR